MALYIRRPIVVEAHQWFPGVELDGVDIRETPTRSFEPVGVMTTNNGQMTVNAGDYIVTGVMGEKYPVEEDAFLRTYAPLEIGDQDASHSGNV